MKYSSLLLLFLYAFAFSFDPCYDSRYLSLKRKPLDSMSQREYDYFMLKEKHCLESVKNNSHIKTSVACSLLVTIEKGIVEKEEFFFTSFYLDGVEYKMGKIELNPGIHTVCLYSNEQIESKKGDAKVYHHKYKNISHSYVTQDYMYKQMLSTSKKIELRPGDKKRVHYVFNCDNGGKRNCDDDEWWYEIKITNLK